MAADQPRRPSLVSRISRKLKKTRTVTAPAAVPSASSASGPSSLSQQGSNLSKSKSKSSVLTPSVPTQNGKLQKRSTATVLPDRQDGVNELGERTYSVWSDASTLVGGRTRDHTDMIHGLAHHGSFDSLVEGVRDIGIVEDEVLNELQMQKRRRCEEKVARISGEVWRAIVGMLDVVDAASLAISSKVLLGKIGVEPFKALSLEENRRERIRFLNYLDRHLPGHLLCFPCASYHCRLSREEKLKADFVGNPVFICPKVFSSYLPRMRLTNNRELPYAFVQLATRHRFSKHHGIHPDRLTRRWKDEQGWSHASRYMLHDGRLLMRIRSQVFAPPKLTPTGERMLLYDRENYIPFFSVCAHWRDGELMPICKCALSHVPGPQTSLLDRIRESPELRNWMVKPGFVARQCDECRPARRCPECPTEYLVEVSMAEDPTDPINRFKHVLVVTRWSDLGDGSSPTASPEYCAINGVKADYDSFSSVGRRAVAGIFESKMSGAIPGQRMISLNPKNQKFGEAGHGWY